ncbi:tetratricopeptide repeat protein [Micromonospora sp. WMMD1102]|uniref:ATP-binding protein n=1 Tax=Micromonospora sp. WMMD1102 TaxID=3016105 RepID=UPI002414D8D7|nr:tetratricopeptide repeat protein [Micromonospora sp. WMMD1102]MDG4788198.1 tetratricopeptide repeat protein [Micromonospora sp. WMMD1102]
MADSAPEVGAGVTAFGAWVRAGRLELGWTQEEFADQSGLSVRTVRNLEAGRGGTPRPDTRRLAIAALSPTDHDRTTPVPPVRPAQLPADIPGFTGRAEQLRRLDALLDADPADSAGAVPISLITGTAGVGKSALAVHWAHRVADRFPDGQLYVNLRGYNPSGPALRFDEAVRAFLDALEVPPERLPHSVDAQAGLYRSLLAGKRVLVVLDNARDPEQVRGLLPGTAGCLVVITSRDQLTGLVVSEAAVPLRLDQLTEGEARSLLAHRLSRSRVAAESAAVDLIVALSARLPLALAIVAGRAATAAELPLATLADEMRQSRGRLDAFVSEDPSTDVRAVFSWSYHRLSQGAARLFRLLGLHPGPHICVPAAASLAGVTVPEARRLLTELTCRHLFTEHSPGRYTTHELLQAYAAELVRNDEPDGDRDEAVQRMLDHYLHTAHRAATLLFPETIKLAGPQQGVVPEEIVDDRAALDWFATEHHVLLAIVDRAETVGSDTHVWQLAWSLETYFDFRGYWHDLAATQEQAVAAASRLADPTAQAHAYRGLGGAHLRMGRYDTADRHHRSALDLFTGLADRSGQARSHRGLAWLCSQRDRHAEALEHNWQALSCYEEVDNRAGQASTLNSVGYSLALTGDHRQAVGYCRRALAMLREIGDQHSEAATWDSLGYAYHHLGENAKAIECYRRALDLHRMFGERYFEAIVLTHLGEAYDGSGQPEAAGQALRQAQEILAGLGRTADGEFRD